MKNNILFGILFVFFSPILQAVDSSYFMYVGEVKIYTVNNAVDRVAVGNGKIVSTSITKNGQLILIAESIGDSNIHIWMSNGEEYKLKVYVTEKDSNRLISELKVALSDVKNLSIKPMGDSLQLSGKIFIRHKTLIETLEKKYKFTNLIKYEYFGQTFEELKQALHMIEGVDVSRIGDLIVIKGDVEKRYKPLLDMVIKAYTDIKILNLTQEPIVIKNKMIYMNVKITEMANNDLSELGISWDTQVNGPNAFISKGKADGVSLDSVFSGGFFGITSEITSRINLLVSNGDAIILAEPRLSAYSGGKAEFIAGGQLPIPVTNQDGSISVEYKDYGIILKIQPLADDFGNISAHVETEISSVDKSVTVNGIPGIKNRKTSTDIVMRDKQTLVISGLINNEISADVNKLPWLGDIPVLGNLFKSKSFRNQHSQMVIFVTPTIYDADSDINKQHLLDEKKLLQKFKSKLGLKEIID